METATTPLPPGIIGRQEERKVEDKPVTAVSAAAEPEQPNGWVLLIFLAFFLCCFIAWFATSRVYRASLPELQGIEADAQEALTRLQPIVLVLLSTASALSTAAPSSLTSYAQSLPSLLSSHLPAGYSVIVSVHVVPEVVSLPLSASSSLLYDVDDALQQLAETLPSPAGDGSAAHSTGLVLPPLLFFFVHTGEQRPQLAESWYQGSHQHGFHFLSSLETASFSPLLPRLTSLLSYILSFHSPTSDDPRRLPYQPAYRLSLTLLTSRPEPWAYSWDFDSVRADWLDPFIAATSHALSLSVDSQSLQFFDLLPTTPPPPTPSSPPALPSSVSHVVKQEQLMDLVGRMGWMVPSPLARHSVELVAFIPSNTSRPLHVRSSSGVEVDSFVIPGWGGWAMVNADQGQEDGGQGGVRHLGQEAVDEAMGLIVSLIRIMLGLPEDVYSGSGAVTGKVVGYALLASPVCIAEWERTALFARFLSLSLHSALHDLRALHALVDTVPHMPVEEAIAGLVAQSIEAAATARAHCEAGRWEECGRSALQSSSFAHEAFYAPSLLPSLYFPEEHVYAVYAPLFLPIGLPVLAAVVARVRQWRKRRTKHSGIIVNSGALSAGTVIER